MDMNMDMSMDMNMDMNNSGDGGMSMPMYFSDDKPVIVVFKNWVISDAATLAGSCIGVALIAILYEVIKRFRYYFAESYFKDSPYVKKSKVSPSSDTKISQNSKTNCSRFWAMHLLNSLSFLIQVFTSYLLMLIVMTYNYWLFISVVLGLGVGYFFASSFTINLGEDKEHQHDQCIKITEVETVDQVYVNETAISGSKPNSDTKALPVITDELTSTTL